jgi:adenine-specific DNA-methyltransferase
LPTLNWIGKEKVVNLHHDVPFRVLDHKYGFKDGKEYSEEIGEGNMIIHGDNLEALKSLLPKYEGKIKCIYIDPPYNTGNEGWIYNDNVNSEKIKKWVNSVVGKEGEDLSRHDKWLCMIYPRLKLLHRLISNDGILLVSIDDFEFSNLKLVLDEIFGLSGFFANFVWRRRVSSSLAASWISKDHEYVVAYSKCPDDVYVHGEERDMEKYNIPDGTGRYYASMPLTVGMTKDMRPNQWYELRHPATGNGYWPPNGRVWGYYPPTMEQKIKAGLIIFPEDFPNKKLTTPRLKSYPEDTKRARKPLSTWIFEQNQEVDTLEQTVLKTSKNEEGTRILKNLFGDGVFPYAKPLSLIQSLIGQFSKDDDIILDSFAGSGTTAHAVLNLNKIELGSRRFILIETENYAESITSERVKRVISGVGGLESIPGRFDFFNLGCRLFTGENNEFLNEDIHIDKIHEYIWFSETRSDYVKNILSEKYLLGKKEETVYYFVYEKSALTTLDYDLLSQIHTKAEQYIIYADNCLLAEDFMTKHNIIFKKIPRDITRF